MKELAFSGFFYACKIAIPSFYRFTSYSSCMSLAWMHRYCTWSISKCFHNERYEQNIWQKNHTTW